MAAGRVDVIFERARHAWLIEIKRDSTPAEALAQIEESGCAARYASDDRVLHKVGCSFDTKTRLLEDWLAEERD